MKKFLINLLIFSTVYSCPQMDKVKNHIKEKINETVDRKLKGEIDSNINDKLEVYIELYEFIEEIEKPPGFFK